MSFGYCRPQVRGLLQFFKMHDMIMIRLHMYIAHIIGCQLHHNVQGPGSAHNNLWDNLVRAVICTKNQMKQEQAANLQSVLSAGLNGVCHDCSDRTVTH